MKKFIKKIIPPIILELISKINNRKIGWFGNYESWEEAKKNSTGYDTYEILNKVKKSLLKVKKGEAVYERDSVIFDEIQYSWPLLSGLMFAAAKSDGKLNVIDFGGSLGSTYFQNIKFLDGLNFVSWNIVEQKHFVDAGKKDFEDDRLHFYYDVETCIKEQKPKILILSGVLQYLEEPYIVLNELLTHNLDFIIIDRTPFNFQNKDVIKRQIVPESIYKAVYPCHLFSMQKQKKYFLSKGFKLFNEFDAIDGTMGSFTFKGMIYKRVKDV